MVSVPSQDSPSALAFQETILILDTMLRRVQVISILHIREEAGEILRMVTMQEFAKTS